MGRKRRRKRKKAWKQCLDTRSQRGRMKEKKGRWRDIPNWSKANKKTAQV